MSEQHKELFLTIQHTSAVVVYRKGASGQELPMRLLQGDLTQLADPHGIAVDEAEDTIFVTNHGSVNTVRPEAGAWIGPDYVSYLKRTNWPLERDFAVPGSGRILPPSVTVYSRTGAGNTKPIRVIQGPKTQLNWPSAVVLDHKRGEMLIANDTGDAVLAFRKDASGDVAPTRVLRGPSTGLKNPTGLFLDTVHDELWVANFGAHTVTVYPATAQGDTPPLRTIRSGPAGSRSLMIGNPGALAFDSKREEILVPN
jgi:DNA-binding beta-propeller fold protein YncE